ncbi:MAG: DUF5105 domain-containing protein [Inconstantimicrobium porci]|uniref:DUF5105 domain-containing protein n=1 Tax=Inconstantimicrobium porci TaxID=2652291 RepID=UPI0024091803|nr:DUF5105 domain-containing protein [Inconstantimicrobium porci]MDD6769355.1 DUF5105 domain-containing protein [Inconstantimicrobium porci]MDY5911417.1 DUF5105 domain-containing protein [Inconstantimicrobium porci]
MKKIFTSIISVLLISSMLFMGCGAKRVDAKTAADCLINTLVLNKDAAEFKKVFNEDASGYEKAFKDSFISSFKRVFTASLGISSSKELDTYIDNLYNAFKKKVTSGAKYKVTVKNETKDSASILIEVNGIDMKQVQSNLQKELKAAATADPSLATDKKKLANKTVELYADVVNKANLTSTAQEVTINLEASNKKSCWKISNAKTAVSHLIKAFYLGQQ